MRRTPVTAAAFVLTAVATATAATTVPATAASAPKAPRATVVVNCFGAPKVRPTEIILACADANDLLSSLRWTSWGGTTATGGGVRELNDCVPTCVAGHFHSYPIRITLSGAQLWAGHPGVRRFTALTFRYTGARPRGEPVQVTGDIP
ncbi:hypothetical protein [Peterkaempfera griseoplana]|uniref:hypothetical protein n=1 Tax=Peterkaempfera griseoplana TaxID=66896 RepID=UPI0006E45659|nr:hypothetical protein [Peterkaempfera griseoplana]